MSDVILVRMYQGHWDTRNSLWIFVFFSVIKTLNMSTYLVLRVPSNVFLFQRSKGFKLPCEQSLLKG